MASTRTAGLASSWASRPRTGCSNRIGEESRPAAACIASRHKVQPPALLSLKAGRSAPCASRSHAPSIERIHASQMTPSVFRRYQREGIPFILEGCLRPPCNDPHEWSLYRFASAVGDEALTCRIHGGDGFATDPHRWTGRSHMRTSVITNASMFAESISSGMAASNDCYVQHDISRTDAGLKLASTFDAISRTTGLRIHPVYGPLVNMWWGPSGHTEPLHMDVTDGTLLQLYGTKRIVLFPPECWRDLRPYPLNPAGMSWAFSQLNLRQVLAADPWTLEPKLRFALEKRIEFLLREGEILFIPACAAHEISGLDDDILGSVKRHGFAQSTDDSALSHADDEARCGSRGKILAEAQHHVLSVNRFWATASARVVPYLPEDARRSFEAGVVAPPP